MKKVLFKIFLCMAVLSISGNASAQGFLKKVSKAATSLTKSDEGSSDSSETASQDKIKASDIPSYTCQKFIITDENGNTLKNEDGTDMIKYFLVDKNGNKVSKDAVSAQITQVNKAVLAIAAKAAMGAGIGALSGGAKGAIIGLAASLGLSVNDIQTIIKLKKDLGKQKKMLDAYQKSFDAEGNPVAALDPADLKNLGISESTTTSITTEKVKEELSRPEYTNLSSNESLDALLSAATSLENS